MKFWGYNVSMAEKKLEKDQEDNPNETFPILVQEGQKPPTVIRITKRNKEILESYIELGSTHDVSRKFKIGEDAVKSAISDPVVQHWLKEKTERTAKANNVTPERIMALIDDSLSGAIDLSPSQARMVDLATKILKMVQPATHTTFIQNNEFSKLSDKDLDKQMADRLGYQSPPPEMKNVTPEQEQDSASA